MVVTVLRIMVVGFLALALLGCPTGRQYSIGAGPTISASQRLSDETSPETGATERRPRSGGGIDVILVSYDKALHIALKVAKTHFVDADVIRYDDGVRVTSQSFMLGNVVATIKPKLVKSLEPGGGHGFTFETRAAGIGANPSMIPGYLTSEFFSALARYRSTNRMKNAHFSTYELTDEKGVTEVMPADAPITYEEFVSYLDKKRKPVPFEGIWSDHTGKNVLGIVADKKDPLYGYKAFVISSKEPSWEPGDIKIKFNRLRLGRASISQFWGWDKRETGLTWDVNRETMISLNSVDQAFRRSQVALVKTYPTERKGETVGVGTGWAVTDDGVFATNHHVIDDADSIWVGFRGGKPKKARVIAVDERVDLALIRIEKPDRTYRPLPLAKGRAVNGTAVTVIGFPLAFNLGDDPRVTDGIISAQKGIDSDITRYQISAAVQHGNSGGPVLNNRAEVVGVVVQKYTKDYAQNVGFAVKIPYLKLLMEAAGIEYARGRSDGTRTPKELFEIFGASVLPVWTKR